MSEIILYRIKEDLCILQEYLNSYFSKYFDKKYKIYFINIKKYNKFINELQNNIQEINTIIDEFKIYQNDNFIFILLRDLLKLELKIKNYFLHKKKLLFLMKNNRRKYNLKFAKYYKIIDICNVIYLDIILFQNKKK